jgi:hypothetical protein
MPSATVYVPGNVRGLSHTGPDLRTPADALAWARGYCTGSPSSAWPPLPTGTTVRIGTSLYMVTPRGGLQALGGVA